MVSSSTMSYCSVSTATSVVSSVIRSTAPMLGHSINRLDDLARVLLRQVVQNRNAFGVRGVGNQIERGGNHEPVHAATAISRSPENAYAACCGTTPLPSAFN